MTSTPTQVAAAAAERFRVLRERAANRLAKAKSDATTLRARVQRESREMMADAKRRKDGGEQLVSPWPDQAQVARYQFDDTPDDVADHLTHDADATPRSARAAKPAPVDRSHPDQDDDDTSQVDTWLGR